MKVIKMSLLLKVFLAIILGVGVGFIIPFGLARVFITFNVLFSNFLNFIIPLLVVGLVAPGIADLGRGAGRLLLITALLSYAFTLFSGFLTYFSCNAFLPSMLEGSVGMTLSETISTPLTPYFTVEIPPLMGVMTALILAFTVGLGMSLIKGEQMKSMMDEFREIITIVINKVIIPLLPLYIMGIFINMTISGEVASVIDVFIKLIALLFVMTILLLLIQFCIAGAITGKHPIKALLNMIPAYLAALGTQSSAATIPITMQQSLKNGVRSDVASFVVPVCATIHLSGSTMKIVACSIAIMLMSGMPYNFELYVSFILMLGITMVAAPGVPGGAIMAALGLLITMLHFDENAQALMIALYIAMDSFGTACNVTGDGAIALIVDKIQQKREDI